MVSNGLFLFFSVIGTSTEKIHSQPSIFMGFASIDSINGRSKIFRKKKFLEDSRKAKLAFVMYQALYRFHRNEAMCSILCCSL